MKKIIHKSFITSVSLVAVALLVLNLITWSSVNIFLQDELKVDLSAKMTLARTKIDLSKISQLSPLELKSFSDEETVQAIKEVYSNYNYLIDPHGAVGFLALKDYVAETANKNINGVVVETAHHSKFADIVENVLNIKVEIPERLAKCLTKEKQSIKISKHYNDFREFLLNTK